MLKSNSYKQKNWVTRLLPEREPSQRKNMVASQGWKTRLRIDWLELSKITYTIRTILSWTIKASAKLIGINYYSRERKTLENLKE